MPRLTETAVLAHARGLQRDTEDDGVPETLSTSALLDQILDEASTATVRTTTDQTTDTSPGIDVGPDATVSVTEPSAPHPADTRPAIGVERQERLHPARQQFRSWSGRYVNQTIALDVLVGLTAMLVIGALAEFTPLRVAPETGWVFAGALLWPTAVALVRGYERSRVGIGGDEMRALLRAALLVVSASAIPAGLFEWQRLLTGVVVSAPLAVAASLAVRFVTRKRLHHQQRAGQNVRKVVVVGSVDAAADLGRILEQEKHCGMHVVGVCVPGTDVQAALARGLNVLGDLEEVPAAIREFACDAVAVTSGDATRHSFLRELSWSLEGTAVELLVHPGLIEVAGPRMHIRPFVGLPLLYVEQPHFTGWRRLVKRATDVVLSLAGILALSPLLAAIATAIKLQDGGPIIFRQTRIGTAGQAFTMLKFRSMVVDAETRKAALAAQNEAGGPLFKMRHDPRITRLGRFLRDFSLDELPQLFNVLGGSMSLVGPRPQLESEVEKLQSDARRRLLVTPGVTGLWQVSGRSDLAWEESVRLDLRYVENWSFTLDLHIMWRTIHAVISRRGAS